MDVGDFMLVTEFWYEWHVDRWANSGLAQTKKFWSGKNPDQNENLVWIDENEIEWSSDIFQSIAIQF